jgi:D-sedoheptulose 7-phosphate isomerase
MKSKVQEMLDHNISCTKNIDIDKIIDIVGILQEARDSNKQIFIFGNGGSASTASHLAADLQKTALLSNKNRFRAMSLVDNTEVISAWSNDVSYNDIFAEQIKTFANEVMS